MKQFAAIALLFLGAHTANAQNWVELTPIVGPAPSARGYASGVLDTQNNRIIFYAGQNGSGFLGDIWAFDLNTNTWADLTPVSTAPADRRTPASIYMPGTHTMTTWSGQASGIFFNDVWRFDLSTNQWTEFSPTGGPPNIRYGVATILDPTTDDLVTFAGFTNMGRFDDVWRFNADSDTWTDVSPGSGPIERCLHSASYDSREHRMIMYGGQNGGALDDIWAFDLTLNTWVEFTPGSKPAGRSFPSNIYDTQNHRITVFGGSTNLSEVNEVWVFDLWAEAWTQLSPTGTGPTAREAAAAVYDEANDRMIIVGGNGPSWNNDVFALENLSGTATSARPLAHARHELHQNHPNPFNPSTLISFELARRDDVTLSVFDVRGAHVRSLVRETRAAGIHNIAWDGRDDAGRRVASGVYLYRLSSPGFNQTRKLVVIK